MNGLAMPGGVPAHPSTIAVARLAPGGVLVATDGWPASSPIVIAGVALARALGLPLVIVHSMLAWRHCGLVRSTLAAAEIPADPQLLARAEDCLDRARILAVQSGVRFETRLAFDPDPARAVLDAARDTGCAVIVLGADTQGPWRRRRHIARRILADAQAPVLVVPLPPPCDDIRETPPPRRWRLPARR
ncbi:universal stress protein [Luteibacter sahnii]|uniref:universal stress protein n=1 Tax=Luteibacter sahnii TaxID=3021977 RepID=UPI002A6B634C|nr:universal stress protein [Luteibacter sp. PPL193]MDY1546963.1 universal stress protein [Luteibacter sp. PPL193]